MTINPKLPGCEDISIYMGNACNFNCSYCDRDFIKNDIGSQQMEDEDIPQILNFLKTVSTDGKFPVPMLSFHGGEPFVFVKHIDKILDAVTAEFPDADFPIFIQTNGSRIVNNEWFLAKWNSRLHISISYDFIYQQINRSGFDIDKALVMLKKYNVQGIQLQYVMPIQSPDVFSLRSLKSITDLCYRHNIRKVDLIPLRHIRGQTKFQVVIDNIDLKQFFQAFMKFIQMLYVMGIDVIVDGHSDGIDKHYYENHKQMVLSPDGYIYPEYDFLEYQRHETVIGTWKGNVEVYRSEATAKEDSLIHEKCKTCPSRSTCGLKFLYHMWEKEPGTACVTFYQMVEILILHAQKLKEKQTLLHWIGI